MRKFIVLILLVSIIFCQFSFSSLAAETDVIIDNSEIIEAPNKNSIKKGDKFTIKLTLKDNTISDDGKGIDNLYILIDRESAFQPVSGGAKIPAQKVEGQTNEYTVSIKLTYNGEDNKNLFLTLEYTKDGKTLTTTDYIYIAAAIPYEKPEIPNIPDIDTTKLAPKLIIPNSSMPVARAGSSFSIPITIKNSSIYEAKDVVITPILNADGGNIFVTDQLKLSRTLDSIKGNSEVLVTFNLRVSETAAKKVYPIEIRFQYANPFGDEYSTTEMIYVQVNNNSMPPRIILSKFESNKDVAKAGDSIRVAFTLGNLGTRSARNLKVSLDGLKDDGFYLHKDTNTRNILQLASGRETTIAYDLIAAQNIAKGNYELTLSVKYSDEEGNEYTVDYQIFLTAVTSLQSQDSTGTAEVMIDKIDYPKQSININEDFTVKFQVRNNGKGMGRNIKVSVSSDAAIIPKTPSIRMINSLPADGSQDLSFVLSATSEAITKNYPIAITIEYDTGDKEELRETVVQYVGAYIVNYTKQDDDDDQTGENESKPKIIVDQYRSEPSIVRAGENYSLKVSFLNTHKFKTVQNIKVALKVNESTNESGSVFTPVNSSNTFYIDEIAPKGSVERELLFYTIPDAQPRTYTIEAHFEYEDDEGKEYTAIELIGIPVVQQARLETSELGLPPQAFAYQPIPLSLEFYNTGRVTLYNLMIKTEGDLEIQNGNYFVGNFQSGSSDYYEAMITPTMPGIVNGSIVFTYDDAAGEHKEYRKEFTLNVEEMYQPEFPQDGDDGMWPEEPIQEKWYKKILKNAYVWAGAGVILAIIVAVILRKRYIKKKGMTFDEEY